MWTALFMQNRYDLDEMALYKSQIIIIITKKVDTP